METSSLGIDILNEGKLARIVPKGKGEPSRKSSQEVLLLLELKAKSKSPQANRRAAVGEEGSCMANYCRVLSKELSRQAGGIKRVREEDIPCAEARCDKRLAVESRPAFGVPRE